MATKFPMATEEDEGGRLLYTATRSNRKWLTLQQEVAASCGGRLQFLNKNFLFRIRTVKPEPDGSIWAQQNRLLLRRLSSSRGRRHGLGCSLTWSSQSLSVRLH